MQSCCGGALPRVIYCGMTLLEFEMHMTRGQTAVQQHIQHATNPHTNKDLQTPAPWRRGPVVADG
jgi:hypothetical protein